MNSLSFTLFSLLLVAMAADGRELYSLNAQDSKQQDIKAPRQASYLAPSWQGPYLSGGHAPLSVTLSQGVRQNQHFIPMAAQQFLQSLWGPTMQVLPEVERTPLQSEYHLPVSMINDGAKIQEVPSNPRTTIGLVVEVQSSQLSANLKTIHEDIQMLKSYLQDEHNRRLCPTESEFGTLNSAPCGRLGSSCYCFFNRIMHTFEKATDFCKSAGFDGLVSLETKAEADALSDLAVLLNEPGIPRKYFTSGSDNLQEDEFRWNTTGAPFDSNETNWAPDEPNIYSGLDDNCVVIDNSSEGKGRWKEVNCLQESHFICELNNILNTIG